MSPVPTFLTALADQIDRRIAEGTAMHVTQETAQELRLIAGLPWAECARTVLGLMVSEPGAALVAGKGVLVPVSCADVALGWLLCSRVQPDHAAVGPPFEEGLHEVYGNRIVRAAQCAELVVMAAEQWTRTPPTEDCSTGYPIERITAIKGTKEGARACWSFVVAQLSRPVDELMAQAVREGKAGACHGNVPLIETCLRELEAMR